MSNTIIRASAGSGKTFRLSNEFLNVVFQSDKPIGPTLDSILASTFTRKAAGEITDRIFTKFADVALNTENQREKLSAFLNYPNSDDPDKTLQGLLAQLARNMYRLRVGTLDSYFNKIATAFSLELGLPPGWSMVDDAEYPRFLAEAVREVFNESKRNDARKLMHLFQKGEEKVGMMDELVDLAEKMLPLVRETTRNEWNHEAPERLGNCMSGLLTAEKIDQLLDRLENFPDGLLPQSGSGKNKKANGHFRNAINGIAKSMAAENWDSILGSQLVKAVDAKIVDPGAVCEYQRKDVGEQGPELFNTIASVLGHVKSLKIKILVDQTRATYDLLEMVAEKLDAVMERERKFRFEDITRKIADYGFGTRLGSLQHRLNAETKHLLLDEFQDTSPAQWSILEPLAIRTADDENGTYFCVGDEKQAIYSWRGGEAAIFGSMKNRLKQGRPSLRIKETTEETTHRCAQPIVDAVNTLFQNIADLLKKVQNPENVRETFTKAGLLWQGLSDAEGRFKKHATENKRPGYCTLEESPFVKEELQKLSRAELSAEREKAHIRYVADRIAGLLPIVQSNPNLKEGIGVLVTKNNFGAKIVSALKERDIEVTGKGSSLLQSPAVRHIVSALVFAEHPGDTVARFHLAHGPLADAIKLDQLHDHECSQNIRDRLVNRGYGAVIGDYVKVLADSCNTVELERLEKLREVAYRFDEVSTGVRTRRFIDMIEKEPVSNDNAAKVQVMTIHAAKGLEFDIVVLPQLDEPLQGHTSNVKYVKSHKIPNDPTSSVDFVLRYIGKDLQDMLPANYRAVFEQRVQREVEQSLCKLYVAMTRALRMLVMIVPQREEKEYGTTLENVLRELPPPSAPSLPNILYENGDPTWHGNGDIIETIKECSATGPDVLEFKLDKTVVPHHVPRIVPSNLHEKIKPTNDAKQEKSVRNSEDAALKGTLIHACFENVEWLDDDGFHEDELRELIDDMLEGRTASLKTCDVIAEFRKACQNREIIDALSRSRYLPDREPELERERRFAVWIDHEIMRGSIDRLVVQRDSAKKITKIEILDYKTGDATDDINVLVETYREQLAAYRRAACELYDVDATDVETTLVFVTLGKVVTVQAKQ